MKFESGYTIGSHIISELVKSYETQKPEENHELLKGICSLFVHIYVRPLALFINETVLLLTMAITARRVSVRGIHALLYMYIKIILDLAI